MESSSSSQSRPAHRRSPASERAQPQSQGYQQPMASPSAPPGGGDGSNPMASRASSGSGRSSSAKTAPDKQLSQIEKSVTHLLVATKQLLETLTQWSRQQATESEVSDVYVRLGYEFNLACRAFGAIGVDTADLGPVPDLLRTILEDTLSQDASPQSLDRYLPRIRDIIINLLHGLRKKQSKLRAKQTRDGKFVPPRQGSLGSLSGEPTMGPTLDEPPALPQSPPKRNMESRSESRQGATTPYGDEQGSTASRTTPPSAWSERPGASFAEREASRREVQRSMAASGSSSSLSSNAMQNMPVLPPYTSQDTTSTYTGSPSSVTAQNFPHPPPPPPPSKQDDAIGLLQRSGDLERRASRRFSTYQIQKHLGSSPNGVPVLASQNSPVPNRGRDVRESMNAVRLRGSYAHGRQRSNVSTTDASPNRTVGGSANKENVRPRMEPAIAEMPSDDSSPAPKTPADKLRSPREFESRDMPIVGGAVPEAVPEPERQKATGSSASPSNESRNKETSYFDNDSQPRSTPESSVAPGKELTLFLQYKTKIKKYVLPEGAEELTIGRLQLAFIEKFAWNTHNNGADLPEIYLQDPISGVRHELEDLNDVKDRSVLVLNVEQLDEVKKHFDDGVSSIRRLVQGVRDIVDGQGAALQRLTDRQLEASKDIARLTAASPSSTATTGSLQSRSSDPISSKGDKFSEIQRLRRDVAVLRQTYSEFSSDISTSMNSIRTKAGTVKTAAVNMTIPSYEGDAGRARVNAGKKELADESEKLVARVDDLQDLVEDLRKDVVTRGVRPLPRQLEAVGRDISAVTKELKKMQEFLKREKPIWTKIWEAELQLVCEERDQLTMQEDLAVDLEDDLEKAAQTFALVEQATKQQNVQSTANGNIGNRSVSRNLPIDQSVDPVKAKDNVLGEVRALQPNHEDRVEAIERAEKARRRELESRRGGPFQKELGNFVKEGKLKKSGGVEELERQRKEKDDLIRKEVWERQQARAIEMEQKEREAAAAAAAAASTQQGDGEAGDAEPAGEDTSNSAPQESSAAANDDAKRDDEAAQSDAPGT